MAKRRDSMQVAIVGLIKRHGRLAEFEQALTRGGSFHIRLEQENYLPLVIEVIAANTISVTHYRTTNGDQVQDPEVVFEAAGGRWWPIEITQGPVGVYRHKFLVRDGKKLVDLRFHGRTIPFVNLWAKNIRNQGWDKATAINANA